MNWTPRADLVAGAAFTALGLAAVEESWRMPTLAEFGVEPWSAPGVVPALVGAGMVLSGLLLALRAVRAGALERGRTLAAELGFDAGARRRVLLALLLMAGYAIGLVGRVPFRVATFVFVLTFVLLFRLPRAENAQARLRETLFAVSLAAATALGVGFVFEYLFYVRLP